MSDRLRGQSLLGWFFPLLCCVFWSACSNGGSSLVVDAGSDASPNPIDGSSRDGSILDAGLDGATKDAFTVDADSNDAGSADTGGRDASEARYDADTPLLERTPRLSYDCTVERGVTNHMPDVWAFGQSLVATALGNFMLARIEAPALFDPPNYLELSRLTLNGTIGLSSTITPSLTATASLHLAPAGEGSALVWVEGNQLQFEAFAPLRQVVVPAHPIAGTAGLGAERPRLAHGSVGYGLIFESRQNNAPAILRFIALDDTGAALGVPVTLATASEQYVSQAATIVSTPSGFAIAYRDIVAGQSTIHLVVVTPDGGSVASKRISPVNAANTSAGGDSGFGEGTIALVALGSEYLVAWSEVFEDVSNNSAHAIIRIVRVDSSANPVTPIYAVQAPVQDVDNIEPSLHLLNGQIALLFAQGSHIYLCGGCFPDHHLELVLLDPTDLTPESNVLDVPNPTPNGVLRRSSAVLGRHLLTTFHIMSHVSSWPGSASLFCQ